MANQSPMVPKLWISAYRCCRLSRITCARRMGRTSESGWWTSPAKQASTSHYLSLPAFFGELRPGVEGQNGRYRLGLKIVELYNVFMRNNSLRAVAYDYMVALSQETQRPCI